MKILKKNCILRPNYDEINSVSCHESTLSISLSVSLFLSLPLTHTGGIFTQMPLHPILQSSSTRPLSVSSLGFMVEGNRYVSDGTHQCSACVVKLSAADRLTDVVSPSITSTEKEGRLSGEKDAEGETSSV